MQTALQDLSTGNWSHYIHPCSLRSHQTTKTVISHYRRQLLVYCCDPSAYIYIQIVHDDRSDPLVNFICTSKENIFLHLENSEYKKIGKCYKISEITVPLKNVIVRMICSSWGPLLIYLSVILCIGAICWPSRAGRSDYTKYLKRAEY